MVLLNRYPGLSFWGGLAGGAVVLYYLVSRTKLNFWQIADFIAAGFLAGMVLGDIGCFLGGCAVGMVSGLPGAVSMIGLVGKRFPIQIVESLLLLLTFFYLWGQVVRFHFAGKIVALFLILLGIIKFFTQYFRDNSRVIPHVSWLSYGQLFSLTLTLVGLYLFYLRSKRSWKTDIKKVGAIFSSPKGREAAFLYLKKSWHNRKINSKVKMEQVILALRMLPKRLRRKLNVKPTPKNFS